MDDALTMYVSLPNVVLAPVKAAGGYTDGVGVGVGVGDGVLDGDADGKAMSTLGAVTTLEPVVPIPACPFVFRPQQRAPPAVVTAQK